jgi:hypothetical protein
MNGIGEAGRSVEMLTELCRELVALAKHEEDSAAAEASRTPYWSPCPPWGAARGAAGGALRAVVERLQAEARPWSVAS